MIRRAEAVSHHELLDRLRKSEHWQSPLVREVAFRFGRTMIEIGEIKSRLTTLRLPMPMTEADQDSKRTQA